ncbi:hypothetical protein LCGC14_2749170 [marine sediment metagenome]|uniref:Uncharacterized protein n=1 Tax=marine sediment metagenome TaxID=412755 RepID=A0A0F8ZPC2_9ZZZZ
MKQSLVKHIPKEKDWKRPASVKAGMLKHRVRTACGKRVSSDRVSVRVSMDTCTVCLAASHNIK